MPSRESARAAIRRIRWTSFAALVVTSTGLLSVVGCEPSTTSPPSAPSSSQRPPIAQPPLTRPAHNRPSGSPEGPAGEADGVVPDGVTVFDDAFPAVAKLNPALLRALRSAAMDAADDGIKFYVNSGWRSPKYQTQLLEQAISKYGSEKAAERWVATPDTSAHVSGAAVDLGRSDATTWLSKHGAAYGLCQIYRNETWHYELRPEAIDHGCPPMYADPTQDPRMQQ
jgi:zinc D-Ala-D-Ala carboxypeptidase